MGMVNDFDAPRASASSSEHQNLPPAAFILLGKTGSGKSSFIKLLDGKNVYTGKEPDVDNSINSATLKAAPYNCYLNDRPVIIIDTPGFDDSARDNIEILNDIVSHLLYLERSRFLLQGVIFLHDISEKKLSGSQKKTLSILQQICGKMAMRNVIIGTTMWIPQISKRLIEQKTREAELLKQHWGGIHSTVRLFEDDVDAAKDIVNALLLVPRIPLLVIEEMHQTRILAKTTVGKTIFAEGTDEFERLRREGKEKDSGVLDDLLKKLESPADMTFVEKFGLALAAPIVLAPTALVAAPVGVIYALVHGANYLFGNKK